MAKESFGTVAKRRLSGIVFIAIVVALVALSIAIYNKVFTKTVDVTLKVNHTGNQLILDSDVKVRGLIVGSVKAVAADGDGAKVTLALEPNRVDQIPGNVRAQILPKTLFGEQYVDLVLPSRPARHIEAGDVIPQDRSKGALEAQDVLGDLYPLLTAVQPAELNDTLNALATALNGRGKKLGDTLATMDRYLKIINPSTRKLVDDLHKLGQVSEEYNGVSPDIFATLKNLQTSVRTVVQRRAALTSLLTTGSTTANVIRGFLSDNRSRLIEITGQTVKMYALLEKYSPEYVCLFQGINKLADLANDAIHDSSIHLTGTLDNTNLGPYKQGQEPKLVTGYGPNCFGLPNPQKPFQIPGQYRCLNDGAPLTGDACGASAQSAEETSIGSPQENALVNTLIASKLHTTPNKVPGTATLLAGPLYRGNQVVIK